MPYQIGKGIWRDGSYFNILSIKFEMNSDFGWYKIEAIWSHLGPIPYFPKEKRTFLVGRFRLEDNKSC